MPGMSLHTNGHGCWPDLSSKEVIHTTQDIQVALLRGGMSSGKSSVAFRIELPTGQVCIAETSLELFTAAARAMKAADGGPTQ